MKEKELRDAIKELRGVVNKLFGVLEVMLVPASDSEGSTPKLNLFSKLATKSSSSSSPPKRKLSEENLRKMIEARQKKRAEEKAKLEAERAERERLKEQEEAMSKDEVKEEKEVVEEEKIEQSETKKFLSSKRIPIHHDLILQAFSGKPKQLPEIREIARSLFTQHKVPDFEKHWGDFISKGQYYFAQYYVIPSRVNKDGNPHKPGDGPVYFKIETLKS